MFWIALLGMSLSWFLVKLGFLSAKVGILTLVIKVLLIILVIGSVIAMILWLGKKTSISENKQ